MRRIICIVSFTGAVVFSNSCRKENMCDCFKSAGSATYEYRNLRDFAKLYVSDNVNVYITQDSIFEVKVEGGEHLLPLIKTEVVDGELRISNHNKCNWVRSYKKSIIDVYVKMPRPKLITSYTVGEIKSLNTITIDTIEYYSMNAGNISLMLNTTKITGHMLDAGDVTLSGTTWEHATWGIGNGILHCENLNTGYTWITTGRTGDSYVNATSLLIAYLRSSGNVYYHGSPPQVQLNQHVGSGQLIPY